MNNEVRRMVRVICMDYTRRRREMAKNTKSEEVRGVYQMLNDAIDRGVRVCPEDMRAIVHHALLTGNGYDRQYVPCGHNQFYKYKERAMEAVARELKLL